MFPCQKWQQISVTFLEYLVGCIRESKTFIQYEIAYMNPEHVSYQPQNHEIHVHLTPALVNYSLVHDVL